MPGVVLLLRLSAQELMGPFAVAPLDEDDGGDYPRWRHESGTTRLGATGADDRVSRIVRVEKREAIALDSQTDFGLDVLIVGHDPPDVCPFGPELDEARPDRAMERLDSAGRLYAHVEAGHFRNVDAQVDCEPTMQILSQPRDVRHPRGSNDPIRRL